MDRRSRLEALVGLGDTDFEGLQLAPPASARVNVLTFQPQLGLVRDLTRRHQIRVFAGLTYAAVLANPGDRNWHPLSPLFRAELDSWLWRDRGSGLRSSLAAVTTWYADPVLGAAVQRGTAEARLDAQLGPRWDAGARASFTTDLNHPLTTGPGSPPLDETIVQVDVPFRHRWSSQLALDFGARYAERAPNLWASSFGWHSRELWLFATLTTTTRRQSIKRA